MAKRVSLSRGVDPETVTQLKALAARWDCSEGEAIDRAVALAAIEGPDQVAMLSEVLELVRSIAGVMPGETIPGSDQIEMIVDVTMQRKIDERAATRSAGPASPTYDPRSIPGVQVGAQNLRPRRESSTERAQREAGERQARAAQLDSVQDESIDRGDEFVSV